MKKPSAACCSRADAVAAEVAAGAEAAEAVRAAGPAAAASVVALALAAPLLRRWHAQGAAHHGVAVAGARRWRFLTRHRQVVISLAGFASDPANLLSSPRGWFRPAPQLADGERVCSNLFEEGKSLKKASRTRRTDRAAPSGRRAPAIGHDGNRIRVLTR